MWILELCLVVNCFLTVTAFVLVSEPEKVARYVARRHVGPEAGWFQDADRLLAALAVVRLWARWIWIVLVAWGVVTGFLIGLFWRGWLVRFG